MKIFFILLFLNVFVIGCTEKKIEKTAESEKSKVSCNNFSLGDIFGKKTSDLPLDSKDRGGQLLKTGAEYSDFSMAHWLICGKKFILIERLIKKDKKILYREIITGMESLKKNISADCKFKEKWEGLIIANVDWKKDAEFSSAKEAWRIDLEKKEIKKIDPKNIKCFKEGYGI